MLSLGCPKGSPHYRLIALLGWPLLPRGNSASKFQGLEVLSFQDSLRATPTKEYQGDVIANSTPYVQLPTDAPTRARNSFFGSRVTRFVRDPSHHIETPTWISMRRSTSKGGTANGLLIAFWRSRAWVPQASLQADSALTHCQEQKPQDPRRTRGPQEKGRWAISPNSRASHPLHSYAVGYYSRSKYDVPRDWLQEACHMAKGPLRNLLRRIS